LIEELFRFLGRKTTPNQRRDPYSQLWVLLAMISAGLEDTSMTLSVQAVYGWYRRVLGNPKYRGWVILASVIYLLSPFDIAPDFLPFVGQIDDAMILTILAAEVLQVSVDYIRSRKPSRRVASDPIEGVSTIDL
jgi:uncharacterized membrane protein YkvA (DUF1232 family)